MKYIAFIVLWIYKKILKPLLIGLSIRQEKTCRFHPSCSEYSRECFRKYQAYKAFGKTVKRIIRCHPGSEGGVDLP